MPVTGVIFLGLHLGLGLQLRVWLRHCVANLLRLQLRFKFSREERRTIAFDSTFRILFFESNSFARNFRNVSDFRIDMDCFDASYWMSVLLFVRSRSLISKGG